MSVLLCNACVCHAVNKKATYLLTYLRVSPTTSAARVQYSLKIVGDGLGLRRPSESPRATSREREQYIA